MEDYNIEITRLSNHINDVRDILNEIYTAIDNNQNKETVMRVSQYLDKLIVEYMIKNKIMNF